MIDPGQTLMIGSMPQPKADDALAALAVNPLTVPTWPQLPRRSFIEGMIPQYTEGFPGVTVDEKDKKVFVQRDDSLLDTMAVSYEAVVTENRDAFGITADFAAGLHAFLMSREGQEKAVLAKGQITGPFTFGLGLNDSDMKAVWWDEMYRDLVLKGLALKAVWQTEQLKKYADNVLMFCDEPILSALGTPAYIGIQDEAVISGLNEVIAALHAAGAKVGTHCCGNMDWSLLARTDIDIIAFDAYFFGDKVALYADAINEFLKRGSYLAWGIVPTSDPAVVAKESVDGLKKKIEELTAVFVNKGIDRDLLERNRIYTPSCGLGTLPEDAAAKVLEMLAGLAG